jgi:hypothetical protein
MNQSKLNVSCACQGTPFRRALLFMATILLVALSVGAQDTGNGIGYHGGPVMTNPHPVYIIWYGNWSGNSALTLLPSFVPALNGTPYFAINTTYENGSHTNVSAAVTLGAQAFDNYSQTSLLSETGVRNVISSAMSRGAVPVDPNGVYFVLSSGDVNEIDSTHGEFCVDFCGFHGHATLFGNDIKYAFVGNASPKCINNPNSRVTCAPTNPVVSPNGNTGADAMASTIAHELSETVTDPDLNAWFDPSNPSENGDKCNLQFGSTFSVANGSQANISLGGHNFLIQQNWLNDGGGGCTMASTGNPFTYRSARDQFLACYGIAGRISSNCNDISDVNDKQACLAVSTSTQTPCTTSMTDRNMQLACYGIAFAPNFPSNCRDITNPQMQAFARPVATPIRRRTAMTWPMRTRVLCAWECHCTIQRNVPPSPTIMIASSASASPATTTPIAPASAPAPILTRRHPVSTAVEYGIGQRAHAHLGQVAIRPSNSPASIMAVPGIPALALVQADAARKSFAHKSRLQDSRKPQLRYRRRSSSCGTRFQ